MTRDDGSCAGAPDDTVFAAALDLPAHERAAFLVVRCAGDEAQRERVAALLAAAEEAPEFLSQPLGQASAAVEMPGTTIGPYKLLQKIGEGGFGTVWMAEQRVPLQRRVALKIIKVGMDTEEVIARFEAERQALALMDHSNIARVFDAGATTAGRPYFVMELVRGVAITQFCDENRLPAPTRLALFVAVCQAVQHAHQKGVIHRDLKPSNVLVTLHDGVPVAKVIDFGIAKATQGRLTDRTLFTQFHAFMGTPAYTSPEQMEMSGLDVDTRADIYSLGVLLYELLAGEPPFDPGALVQSGLEAMRRTIREVEPPRPSRRLGTLGAERRTTIAQQRGTNPAGLSLLLRGDLDWIVMRCLEKDRTRRYETANALARDIERHLEHEPVMARPPSALYRAQKFTRRHRAGVAATLAIAVAVVGGLITSSTLLVRERAAHGRAAAAERQQGELRRQAEAARVGEERRAARTALEVANRYLADGHIADGLAYLVYAARKDPGNRTLAPRLASVLTSRNFLLPRAAPLAFGSRVLALRFTRDGKSYFAGTEDGTFRVFDAGSGALRREFRVGAEVVSGGWIFAARNDTVVGIRLADDTFTLYDIATGVPRIPSLKLDPVPGSNREIGLSPTGRWIYAMARNEFRLWDAATGAQQLKLDFSTAEVLRPGDFSPADDLLALPVGDLLERWSLPTGQRVGPGIRLREAANGSRTYRFGARFSPDGRRIAAVDDISAQVFDSVSGELVRRLSRLENSQNPTFTAFATNDRLLGRSLFQSGWWDLADGRFFPFPVRNVSEVSLDASGRRAAAVTTDGWLRLFELDGAIVAEAAWPQSAAACTAISPDGTHVLMGTAEGRLHRFEVGRGVARPLELPRPPHPATASFFLPELPARLLVLGSDEARAIHVASARDAAGGFRFPERAGYSNLRQPDLKFMVARTAEHGWQSWEIDAGGVQRIVPLEEAEMIARGGAMIITPTGERMAFANSTAAQVWDLRTGARIGPTVRGPGEIVPATLSFNPDGSRLAVGAGDGTAFVFDVTTGERVLNLATRRQVRTLAVLFSPDGQRLLTTNQEGEFQLWDGKTGERIGPGGRVTASLANPSFSADSRWAVIRTTTTVILLDARTGHVVGQPIPVHHTSARFSSDNTRFVTTGHVRPARVWAVPSGEAVTEPLPLPVEVTNSPAEFSPDGRFLKVEAGNELYLWSVPPPLPERTPPPDWLLDLATLCAGQVVNEAGQLVPALEIAARVDRLRQEIAALPADAPLADWGRWVLDRHEDRPIAPGFVVTPFEAEAIANPSGKR